MPTYMKFLSRFALTVFVSSFPIAIALGQGLVPCSGPECDLCSLVSLAHNLMNFLVIVSVIIATIMFMWAGFMYLTHADNPGKRTEGTKIFVNVFIGLIAILAAWLIVDTVMKVLFADSELNQDRVGRPWQDILCEFSSETPTAP